MESKAYEKPLVADEEVDMFLQQSRAFTQDEKTTSETTTKMPTPASTFKNPFKKAVTATPSESPKGTKRPADDEEVVPASESENEATESDEEEDEEEEDDGELPPNPYFDCEDEKLVDLSATLKNSIEKEKERDAAKKPKKRRRLTKLAFVDDAAAESTRDEEQAEEDAVKPEKKNRCAILSYKGDGPYLQLEKSPNRLLLVKAGKPLRFDKGRNDQFDVQALNDIQIANVYWVYQTYKHDAKPPVYIPCMVSADRCAVKLKATHWREIERRLHRDVITQIIKNKNIDPRVTKEGTVTKKGNEVHADVQAHFGKVPIVPENLYQKLLKTSGNTPGMQIKAKGTKTAAAKPNLKPTEAPVPIIPKEKGQLTLKQCASPLKSTPSSVVVTKPPLPASTSATATTTVPEIARMLEDTKQTLEKKLGPYFNPDMFTNAEDREKLFVRTMKELKDLLDTPDFKKHLKFFWLSYVATHEGRFAQALQWIGYQPIPEPPKPEPIDEWGECAAKLAAGK